MVDHTLTMDEDSKGLTESTQDSPQRQTKQKKRVSSKTDEILPWWVELLFVQIGLPDSWLRGFLKTRKKYKKKLKDNSVAFKWLLISIAGLCYVNPIIREARISNTCVLGAERLLISSKLVKEISVGREATLLLAKRFCNGGDINDDIL